MGTKLIPDERRKLKHADVPLVKIAETNDVRPSRGLLDSIERHGILQPVLLVQRKGAKRLSISDGLRRVAAARELNMMAVPALITEASPTIAATITLEANEHRSSNPIAELHAIEKLMKLGVSEDEIAAATGIAVATIRKRRKLLALSPELRKCWERGEIVTRAAERAAKLDVARQRALVKIAEESGRITAHDVRELRNADAAVALDGLAEQLVELKRDWREDLRQHLRAALGVCEDAANAHPRSRKTIDSYRAKVGDMLKALS